MATRVRPRWISKLLTLQGLLSGLTMIVGGVWLLLVMAQDSKPGDAATPAIVLGVGVAWYMLNRALIWWHQG
jgi:hypothetical protein